MSKTKAWILTSKSRIGSKWPWIVLERSYYNKTLTKLDLLVFSEDIKTFSNEGRKRDKYRSQQKRDINWCPWGDLSSLGRYTHSEYGGEAILTYNNPFFLQIRNGGYYDTRAPSSRYVKFQTIWKKDWARIDQRFFGHQNVDRLFSMAGF